MLGHNNYGKAEVRVLRVDRSTETHGITDLNVSVALAGDLAATHLTGDNGPVLPTDTQKNTVYAFAREAPVGACEEFALRLARHFVAGPIATARVEIVEAAWERVGPHSFVGGSAERRFAAAFPKALWMPARDVARMGIDALHHDRGAVIPGLPSRISTRVAELIPQRLLLPLLAGAHPALRRDRSGR